MEKYLGMPLLETDRLLLRKFEINDYTEVYHNWAKYEETCKHLTWSPHQTAGESKNAVLKWISYYDKSGYYWAIQQKDARNVIGNVFVYRAVPKEDLMEVGICIGPKYWRNGYGKEALMAVMNFLFTEVKVNTIMAKHDCANIASHHLLISCGMNFNNKYQGNRTRRDGSICELIYYTALNSEWLKWYNCVCGVKAAMT